jgi:hypothetical protein
MASTSDVALAGTPAPSLVLYRQSLPLQSDVLAAQKSKRCPKKWGWWLIDSLTGEKVPAGCASAKCEVCAHWAAVRTAGAIGLGAPERFVTLTQVGDDWQTRRARLFRLTHELRREVEGEWQWAYCVEANPRATGFHLHAWQRGSFVKQRTLSRLADGCGLGRVCDIRRWQSPNGLAEAYGVKGLMYGLKTVEGVGHKKYLAANGNRLVHASRGYWLDGDGKPCGLREARRDWGRVRNCEERAWALHYEPRWEVTL